MKSSKILVALFLVTTLLMSIGSAGAYMRKQTEVVENAFDPAKVSCVVKEIFQDNKKTNIVIENTSNIEAYLRLRLVTYWVDGNGDIIFEESKPLMVGYDNEKWLKSADDTYYYKKPVQSGGITENLLKSEEIIQLVNDDDNGKRQVVEVFAEAIQSKPAEAVISAWSVSLDSNGNITDVN